MEKPIMYVFAALSVAIDLLILNFLFLFPLNSGFVPFGTQHRWILILLNILWIFLFFVFRLNDLPRIKQRKKIIWNTLSALSVWILSYFIVNLFLNSPLLPPVGLKKGIVLVIVAVLSWKLLSDAYMRYFRMHGKNSRNILVIGYTGKVDELREYFNHNSWSGYHFKGFIHEGNCPEKDRLSSDYNDIQQLVADYKINELFLNMAVVPVEIHQQIISMANKQQLSITLIPDFGDFPAYHLNYQRFDQMPLISIGTDEVTGAINGILKFSFDIIVSLMVILLFMWWILPLVAILIKMDSPGPVFFIQKRTGYRNKTFSCLKFRTMRKNTVADSLQASEIDSRVTTIGKFLRRTSIDELPQFFNVLAGQMSVVGPRPHMLQHTEMYGRQIPAYTYRHKCRPGITGLAQVRGYRGETREVESMKARIEHDIYYIENWSLWLDIKIILITLKQLLTGQKNAY